MPVMFCEMIPETCENGTLLSVHVSNVLERFFFYIRIMTANVPVCFFPWVPHLLQYFPPLISTMRTKVVGF